MADITYCDPSIKYLVRSICERLEMLRRQQVLRVFVDGIPDEAIDIEADALTAALKAYETIGLLDLGAVRPGRW